MDKFHFISCNCTEHQQCQLYGPESTCKPEVQSPHESFFLAF